MTSTPAPADTAGNDLPATASPVADIAAADAVIVKALADRVARTLEQQVNGSYPRLSLPVIDLPVSGLSEHSVRELLGVVDTLTRREVARTRHGRSGAPTA